MTQIIEDHIYHENAPLLGSNDNIFDEYGRYESSLDRKSFFIACMANLYEYYDFALLGLFASQISQSIFPDQHGSYAIIELYAIFAAGFLMRPLGGLLFGYYADHFGRSKALIIAMMCMSIPSFLIGYVLIYIYQ